MTTSTLKAPINTLLKIICETKHYMLVNKIPGMLCQPESPKPKTQKIGHKNTLNHGRPFLLDELKSQLKATGRQEGLDDLYIVHRIDGPVTGGVLIPKGIQATNMFGRNLKKGGNSGWVFKRRYLGILNNKVEDFNKRAHGLINFMDEKTRKMALTRYKQVKDNLYIFELMTGRKHQIRKGCQLYLHAPIKNDTKYNKDDITFKSLINNEPAIGLHSALIELKVGGQLPETHIIPVSRHVIPMWSKYVDENGHFHSDIKEALLEKWDDLQYEDIKSPKKP